MCGAGVLWPVGPWLGDDPGVQACAEENQADCHHELYGEVQAEAEGGPAALQHHAQGIHLIGKRVNPGNDLQPEAPGRRRSNANDRNWGMEIWGAAARRVSCRMSRMAAGTVSRMALAHCSAVMGSSPDWCSEDS